MNLCLNYFATTVTSGSLFFTMSIIAFSTASVNVVSNLITISFNLLNETNKFN